MNKFKIKVEHVPFHNSYGRIDELSEPKHIIMEYDLEKGKIIDFESFKLVVVNILDDYVDLKIIDNNDIISNDENFKVDYNNPFSEGIIKYNQSVKLYKHVFDASESWTITLCSLNNDELKDFKFYVINDNTIIGSNIKKTFKLINNNWEKVSYHEISDRLMGYDPSESSDSPYGIGDVDTMSSIKEISLQELTDLIGKDTLEKILYNNEN